MALMRINDEDTNIFGSLSFNRDAVIDEETGRITGFTISGVFATHEYIEDLYTIDSQRYKLTDVSVFRESFGSSEYMILYHFTAGHLEIKEENLPEDVKWIMEEEMIDKEADEREWFHFYLQDKAQDAINERVKQYMGDDDENEG